MSDRELVNLAAVGERWEPEDEEDGPTIEVTGDLLVVEVERLRSVVSAARATLLDAARNDATNEEWARQARAALHVLTLPNAWPLPESQSDAERRADPSPEPSGDTP